MKRDLRIAELQFAVEFALKSAKYEGQSSARVQTVPDTRAIRYYTTLGILARPSEMQGRTAFYDKQHVLQLVAIKRLQAEGKTLGDIQTELTGLSNRKLSGIAKLPSGFWTSLEKRLAKGPVSPPKRKPAAQEIVRARADGTSVSTEATRGLRSKSKPNTHKSNPREGFWAAPVEPSDRKAKNDAEHSVQVVVSSETRIDFPGGISIVVPMSEEEVTPQFIETILPKVQGLASDVASVRSQDLGN